MTLLIVDDDTLVAQSLQAILEASGEVTVLAVGTSGKEALSLYAQYKPDILLMDIRMDGMSGLEAGEAILTQHPEARLLFLTTFSDDEYIIKALHIGAKGYLLKQDFKSILPALKAVMEGQTVFGDKITEKLPDLIQSHTSPDSFASYGLTPKEYALIQLVADGLNNKEIAHELFLSEGTVRNYLSVILEKLSLRDRTQLAIFYYKHL
jgi:DNA-binding NarL/FixJ family response regulator